MGTLAKSPSPLPRFAYDWVGGDIRGLSAFAGTLYGYVPEMNDVATHLGAQVRRLVSDAGWQGTAASAFGKAWDRDAVGATALGLVCTASGNIVDQLAVNLAKIENALEQAADETTAHGVAIGATGQPPQARLTDPAKESWRVTYDSFWNRAMLAAATTRSEAASALQQLYAQIAPGEKNDRTAGLSWGDWPAVFDGLVGFWGAPTRYRGSVELKVPGLVQRAIRAFRKASEESRLANARFGPWTDEGKANVADAKAKLAGVEGDAAEARSTENAWSRFWGFSLGDIPRVGSALEDMGGLRGSVLRFGASIPVVDAIAVTATTIFNAREDVAAGVPWQVAYPGEAAGSIAALTVGGVVGNVAMGTTAVVLGEAGATGLCLSVAAGGVGVVAAGVVAYGVGDFAHNLINENWGADVAHHGALAGIGYGIGDSAVKTGQDFVHVTQTVGSDIVHGAESIWHGITSGW